MSAELDIKAVAGPFSAELDLVAGAAQQGAIRGVEQATAEWHRQGNWLPRRFTFSGTVSAVQAGLATPTAYFPFDNRPFTGRYLSVRKIVIGTSSPFAGAVANITAVIFVTTQPTGLANVSNNAPAIDADVTGLSLPTTQFFSSHQLWVRGGEWLVVGIQGSGVVAGVQVFGHARGVEIDDDPRFLPDL